MAEAEVDKLQVIVASLMEFAKEKLRGMKKKEGECMNVMEDNYLNHEEREEKQSVETNLLQVPEKQDIA